MADKTSRFGMAGHFVAMSKFLERGYNVAVPVVDTGDDVFVVDDRDGKLRRVQVKSANAVRSKRGGSEGVVTASFHLSRRQLAAFKGTELYYFFGVYDAETWSFLLVPRPALFEIRRALETSSPRAKRDADAKGDGLLLSVRMAAGKAQGWNADLTRYRDAWPEDFPVISGGPGARRPRGP